jgi:hypothetical protein
MNLLVIRHFSRLERGYRNCCFRAAPWRGSAHREVIGLPLGRSTFSKGHVGNSINEQGFEVC